MYISLRNKALLSNFYIIFIEIFLNCIINGLLRQGKPKTSLAFLDYSRPPLWPFMIELCCNTDLTYGGLFVPRANTSDYKFFFHFCISFCRLKKKNFSFSISCHATYSNFYSLLPCCFLYNVSQETRFLS